MSRVVILEAPAKVNLRLVVLAREASGYHSLETLFCGVSLSDHLEIELSAPGIALEVTGGVDTGPDPHNLVARAARSFYEALGARAAVRVRLEKRIPAAAGLGGGSSDAAATLRGLNTLHDEALSDESLLKLGARLGSDVPFFLTATPYALAWSRGQHLLELEPLPPRPLLIAHPGAAMPTAAAFRRLAELRSGEETAEPHAFPLGRALSWEGVRTLAVNDFDVVAFAHLPRLGEGVRALLDAGARIALLAGSGASIFGVFDSEERIPVAEATLRSLGLTAWRASTLASWPRPIIRD